MQTYRILIGGEWVEPASGQWLETDDPYRAAPWARIPRCGAEDAARAVAAAKNAFETGEWPRLTASARGALLRRLADLIAQEAEALAPIETRDNGKRISEVRGQFGYLPATWHYYAGLADKVEGAVIPLDRGGVFNYTRHEPLGVVAAITPWNSPLMIAAWKLAPALAAGNTIVLKPSELASASTLEFAKLFERAGFPPGVVNVVTGLGSEVGEALVDHPDVAAVSFTGSEGAGRRIAQRAAGHLKRVTLELGGKSPQIVFADADLDDAVNGVVSGIFVSNGQSCVAGSRLIIDARLKDRFIDRIASIVGSARMGDPMDAATDIAPLANRPHFEKVQQYLDIARTDGASCVLGGKAADRAGWFVEPTIFAGVTPSMRIAREEVFGPVLSVMPFTDDAEALALANDSRYGLAAGLWTRDMKRAFDFSERLQAGTVYVNNYRAVAAQSPVGGYKSSGYGRENGIEGIREFLQTKSVWLGLAPTPNPYPKRP